MVRYFSSDYLSLLSFFTTRGISSPYLNGVILFHFFFMICIDQMFWRDRLDMGTLYDFFIADEFFRSLTTSRSLDYKTRK